MCGVRRQFRVLGLILLLASATAAGSIAARAQSPAAAEDAAVTPAQGEAATQQTVLIRNVRMFDRQGRLGDLTVSVLIKEGQLALISEDRIPPSEADLVLDAQQGTMLGRLELGAPAGFLILDQDPRENVEVLLDTAAHTRFAIIKGKILRNQLETISEAEPGPRKTWLAYQPPPFALPVSYATQRKWNRFRTRPVNGLFAGAVALDRQYWLDQSGSNIEQVGDLTQYERSEVRALRFGLVGTLNFKRPWIYTIWVANTSFDAGFDATEDDALVLFDYRLDIPLTGRTSVSVGKQKEPISMERLMTGFALPFYDRTAVSDSMLPARNVGVVFNGVSRGQRMSWAVGAFNDWLDTSQDFDESDSEIIGRISGLPFVSADESNLLHLGLGIRHSDAKEGIRYRARGGFHLSEIFVDTAVDGERLAADAATTYAFEAYWRKGSTMVGGEYVRSEIDAPASGSPVFSGYHVTAARNLTGEMRGFNRRNGTFRPVPVARSAYDGGWGAVELAAQWSDVDLTDGPIDGGRMKVFSTAVNWYLTTFFGLEVQYRRIELDRFGLRGTANGLLTRVFLVLE